jgi:hypothetical protein
VIALRDRVQAQVQAGIAEHQCEARIVLKDGKTVTRFVEHAMGSVERPMSDEALDDKFRGLAVPILPAERVEKLIALCRGLSQEANVGAAVVALATP